MLHGYDKRQINVTFHDHDYGRDIFLENVFECLCFVYRAEKADSAENIFPPIRIFIKKKRKKNIYIRYFSYFIF